MKIFRGRPCSWDGGIPHGERRRRWVINGCEFWQTSKNGRKLHATRCSSSSRGSSSAFALVRFLFLPLSQTNHFTGRCTSNKAANRAKGKAIPKTGNRYNPQTVGSFGPLINLHKNKNKHAHNARGEGAKHSNLTK